MRKLIKPILFLLISFSLSSCAISKAIYLGSNDFSQRTASSFSDEFYNAEDVNGIFPDVVHIKTRTQTFNLYHYYILHDGLLWYKSIDPAKEPRDWTLFEETGIPHSSKSGFRNTSGIIEISADADELVALSVEGNFYRYCFDKTIAHQSNVWLDRQGWPVVEQIYFDDRTANNRSWAIGKRNHHVLYYEDIFGNQHHNGTMEIVTTYVLLQDGQEICYGDPGVPSDFSRNFIGPERGTFKAVALSASASTMLVINEAGEMYTRLADFDTVGKDPMWFKYTYIPYVSDLPGTNYFSNINEWALPAEDWRNQPSIKLTGEAAITRHITILQNGHGNAARELRVAGLDEEGNPGYWYKAIFDDSWEFRIAPMYFNEDSILVSAKNYDPSAKGERGSSLDKSYTGFSWNIKPQQQIQIEIPLQYDYEQEFGWEYHIPNFNILEGDCDLYISWQGETCILKLHPVEMWSYLKRDYLPGRTGAPKVFFATLEIPENAFESLSDNFVYHLDGKFAKYDRELFHYIITASNNYLIIREINNTSKSLMLFLTDGTISTQYFDFHDGHYVVHYEEVERCYSPILIIDDSTFISIEIVTEKITLNKDFIKELKYKIRVLKWSQLTAFKFNASYLPAHYIVKITPLRFVDVPKIKTITSFGKTLVLANSAYTNTISTLRIQLYEDIIKMLKTRVHSYNDLLKELT